MKTFKIKVREFTFSDIDVWADYWDTATDDYLVGMGVDLNKMPKREGFVNMITQQLELPYDQKKSYALIWEVEGVPVGHCNVNDIVFGACANMHLHIWKSDHRMVGNGTALLKDSIPFYFDNLELRELFCEPYALNPAPNKTLPQIGFSFVKKYTTYPGSLNFEQEVNQWVMNRDTYKKLYCVYD
jgi:RimJ/RimL family protein N-acetyltransferase